MIDKAKADPSVGTRALWVTSRSRDRDDADTIWRKKSCLFDHTAMIQEHRMLQGCRWGTSAWGTDEGVLTPPCSEAVYKEMGRPIDME